MFPQWDSIFLDYVSRPEEIIVMSVKQQQRRRSSLSGRNDYLEDMAKKSSSSSSSNTQLPTSTNSPPTPRRGVTGSYLDSLSSAAGGGVDNKPKQQQQQPPIKPPSPPTMKGSAMNYLESLSNPAMSSIPEEDKKPMGEITNNPYVEEVCCIFGLLFVVFFLCYYVTHKNTLTQIFFFSVMVQKTIEYELEVDPSSIVRRILAVREQLSQEWIQDLDTLMQLNDEVMETYEEYVEQLSSDDYDEEDEDGNSFTATTGGTSSSKQQQKAPIFDVNTWYGWSQSLFSRDRDSSPFRKKNFDLLLLMSTQESIHRVLRSYKEDENVRPETFEWLLDFYKDRVKAFFDGHQTFGRAEAFLEEMLQSPPTVIETDTKALGVIAWVNPAKIAEDIVRERSEVALNWLKVAQATQDEHTDLRRLLFTNMVTKAEPEESFSDHIITSSSSPMNEQDIINPTIGAFE